MKSLLTISYKVATAHPVKFPVHASFPKISNGSCKPSAPQPGVLGPVALTRRLGSKPRRRGVPPRLPVANGSVTRASGRGTGLNDLASAVVIGIRASFAVPWSVGHSPFLLRPSHSGPRTAAFPRVLEVLALAQVLQRSTRLLSSALQCIRPDATGWMNVYQPF